MYCVYCMCCFVSGYGKRKQVTAVGWGTLPEIVCVSSYCMCIAYGYPCRKQVTGRGRRLRCATVQRSSTCVYSRAGQPTHGRTRLSSLQCPGAQLPVLYYVYTMYCILCCVAPCLLQCPGSGIRAVSNGIQSMEAWLTCSRTRALASLPNAHPQTAVAGAGIRDTFYAAKPPAAAATAAGAGDGSEDSEEPITRLPSSSGDGVRCRV
jgi:hypothetical protein